MGATSFRGIPRARAFHVGPLVMLAAALVVGCGGDDSSALTVPGDASQNDGQGGHTLVDAAGRDASGPSGGYAGGGGSGGTGTGGAPDVDGAADISASGGSPAGGGSGAPPDAAADTSRADAVDTDAPRPGDAGADAVDAAPVEHCPYTSKVVFLSCEGNKRRRCRYGDVVTADCAVSYGEICVDDGPTGLQGCFDCDPKAFAAHCEDVAGTLTAVYCAANGVLFRTACPECMNGCCNDGDLDGVRGCEGDCNDKNADVFPGQTRFFNQPYPTGQFTSSNDYNCNANVESEYTQQGTCCGCWLEPVPGCGGKAEFRFPDSAFCPDGINTQRCR